MHAVVVPPADQARLAIEMIWVDEGVKVCRHAMWVPAGSRLGDVVASAISAAALPADILAHRRVAVFGRLRGPEYALNDGDRIELTGPLQVDPKVARERRVAHRRAALPRSRWRPQGR